VDDPASFAEVPNWNGDILKFGEANVDRKLVGMKCDIKDRAVPREDAEVLHTFASTYQSLSLFGYWNDFLFLLSSLLNYRSSLYAHMNRLFSGENCPCFDLLSCSAADPLTQLQKLAAEWGIPYIEVSSMTGENVEKCFSDIVRAVLERYFPLSLSLSLALSIRLPQHTQGKWEA
jgi:GTPase SAR1 family protein